MQQSTASAERGAVFHSSQRLRKYLTENVHPRKNKLSIELEDFQDVLSEFDSVFDALMSDDKLTHESVLAISKAISFASDSLLEAEKRISDAHLLVMGAAPRTVSIRSEHA